MDTIVDAPAGAYSRSRRFVYELLHTVEIETRLEHFTRIFIAVLIVLSILSVILESEPELEMGYADWFYGFELFTVICFSMEFGLRVWSCVELPEYQRSFGRLRYVLSPMALIDLLAVLPFYLPALITVDLRFLRGLRLIRLVRVLKLGHYSHSMHTIVRVVKKKRHEMAVSVFIVGILLIFASTIMYYLEHDAQPNAFRSIPAALWWGVATLTTIGYGDIYPVTVLGKVLSAFISILGIGVFALPSGIFVSGFVEEMQHKHQKCPHCGEQLD
jgi:voltage-gated potassium channel